MHIWSSLCRFILYRLLNWKAEIKLPLPDKYLIALAPHTSNWDFVLGLLFRRAERMKCQFLIKDFWFFWPMGHIMRKLGGIPVHRNKKCHLTDQVAAIASKLDIFGLCVTPEGTRKATKEWKKGFYYIALKAQLPIYLYGLDYREKRIVCTKMLIPSGDFEADMATIKNYFYPFGAKKPENFIV